jgi:hypothetical protein
MHLTQNSSAAMFSQRAAVFQHQFLPAHEIGSLIAMRPERLENTERMHDSQVQMVYGIGHFADHLGCILLAEGTIVYNLVEELPTLAQRSRQHMQSC